MGLAMGLGGTVCVTGLSVTYFHSFSPGAAITMLSVGLYGLLAAIRPLIRTVQSRVQRGAAAEAQV
jgi:zinc transport system permease protein